MNKKGFTLVELLATLVILGIIMAIAIPSTVSILDKNKKKTYISDAKRFATLVELKFKKEEEDPRICNNTVGYCITNEDDKYSVSYDLSSVNDGTIVEDPDGGKYNQNSSYVYVIKTKENDYIEYKYYVYLTGSRTVGNPDGYDEGYALVDDLSIKNVFSR